MIYREKEDCFAYKYTKQIKKAQCTALKELYCKKGKCPFYKTQKEENKCRKKYGYHLSY